MPDGERLLLLDAVAGDDAAFRTLHRHHNERMAAVISGIVRDADAAEDCLQETWLLLLRKGHTFRGDSRLSTWLYRLTRNHAISFARGQRVRTKHEVRAEGDANLEGRAHAPGYGDVLLRARLRAVIERLPQAKREILLLHDVHELTHQEIGTLKGIDPGTSRSQLHKARRMMRRFLEGAGEAA